MSQKRYEARRSMAEARGRAALNMPRGMLQVIGAGERAAGERAPEERAARECAAGGRAAEERAAGERAVREQVQDVLAGLRNLGCRADQARRAVALTEVLQCVTLEDRMRAALSYLGRR